MTQEIVTTVGEAATEHQMQLAMEVEQFNIDRDGLPCRYTGERFKRDHPARYKKAIDLLALGQFSHSDIGRIVWADYRTIHQVALTTIKEQQARQAAVSEKAFVGLMVMAERTIELADRAQKPSEAAIPAGIMKDIYLQVGGLPTAHIQVDHRIDCGAALTALLREAEEKVKTIQATVIEEKQEGDQHDDNGSSGCAA